MNSNIELCVMFQFDVSNLEPIMTTIYDTTNNIYNFIEARKNINDCENFTTEQKDHFNKMIDYLESCSYPLVNFHTIHIVSSDFNENKHYVQMNNSKFQALYPNLDDLTTDTNKKKYAIYINYKPNFFKNNWILNITNILPTNDVSTTKPRKEISLWKLINKTISKINISVTFLNCFTYELLYVMNKKSNILEEFTEHPFRLSYSIISSGCFFSFIGYCISKLYPQYSGIIFNGIMGGINYNIFKRILRG